MIAIQRDGIGQAYLQWEQAPGGYKRAWVQHKKGKKDWAKTGRYINVCRTATATGPHRGNPTDFPVRSALSDEQVLEAFVAAICGVTGCELRDIPKGK